MVHMIMRQFANIIRSTRTAPQANPFCEVSRVYASVRLCVLLYIQCAKWCSARTREVQSHKNLRNTQAICVRAQSKRAAAGAYKRAEIGSKHTQSQDRARVLCALIVLFYERVAHTQSARAELGLEGAVCVAVLDT